MFIGRFEILELSTKEDLELFRERWEQLYAKCKYVSPFLCYDWIFSIFVHFGADSGLKIVVIMERGNVVAFIPFKKSMKSLGGINLRILNFFGDEWPTQNHIIFDSHRVTPVVIQETLAQIFRNDKSIFFDVFIRVPSGSPFLESTSTTVGVRHMLNALKIKTGSCVLIKLPDSWEKYRKTISVAHRKTISRRINAMERLYELQMVRQGIFSGKQELHNLTQLLQDAIDVSYKSWQGAADWGRAISDQDTVEFFKDVSVKMAKRGMLDLSVLYANQKAISFVWGIARWPKTVVLKLGFDASYGKLSPGTVHLAKLIEDSIRCHGSEIDFGHEFYNYKSRWSKEYVDLYSVYYFPRRAIPSILRWGFILNKMIKKDKRNDLERF